MRNTGLFTSEGPHRAPAQDRLDRLFKKSNGRFLKDRRKAGSRILFC